MQSSAAFDLLEAICVELAEREAAVFTEDDFPPHLVDDLQEEFRQSAPTAAINKGLEAIERHFKEKGAALPFAFDKQTREFTATDLDYIRFIAFANEHRSSGPDSKDFESRTLDRLALRVTGELHLVGHPRKKRKKKAEFVSYLLDLGFDKNCLEPRDQDGGLDILWLPPLGTVPLRPVVSLQCKNGVFSEDEANKSVGRAKRTLARHSHVPVSNHLNYVVFNDYIDGDRFLKRSRGWQFVPLGLSDLATPPTPATRVARL